VKSRISSVEYVLPSIPLTNELLSENHPDWNIAKLSKSTGILNRWITGPEEFSSHLAVTAARTLFARHSIDPASIDYLIVCTQTPDFPLPTTACVVQPQIGLRMDAGAVDITLGCSGYIYALALAKGLIESGQVRNVLVITVDTVSKLANENDKATRPIFGDAAAATLVVADDHHDGLTGFALRTDGSGGPHLVVPNGGLRPGKSFSPASAVETRDFNSNGFDLYLDGMEIFNFTLRVVPECVEDVLAATGLDKEEIDLFIFHQANGFLIEHLRKKLEIPADRFVVAIENYGNTSSASIPIALTDAVAEGRVKRGSKVMLVGFGVGLSWGGVLVTW
jgi:3-oxoacyl-[acyl-carrier-protein] synthase-3